MSVRQDNSSKVAATAGSMSGLELENVAQGDAEFAEGSGHDIAQPENPLTRNVVVSIRASLNELCLQKQKGTWAPSQEALRSIFQQVADGRALPRVRWQKRFTNLEGSAEPMGDLKSIVLHDMKAIHIKSTFPCSLGTRVTGVDDKTYSSTGEAFSTIVLPQAETTRDKHLQADDTSLAYEFAKKFPGYTADNLSDKGIHEVSQRRFVLVSADHPIVSAISENADKLQMGEISMMPEGLVKISQSLYESILPLVKTQVESQIKVRDFSHASVSIQPAEYASWSDMRSELMVEQKRPLKAQLSAELGAAPSGEAQEEIRSAFNAREKALEHELDHRPMDMHMEIAVAYNFLSK